MAAGEAKLPWKEIMPVLWAFLGFVLVPALFCFSIPFWHAYSEAVPSDLIKGLKLFIEAIGAFTVVFTITYGYLSYSKSVENNLKQHNWNRKNRTLDLIAEFESSDLAKARDEVRPYVHELENNKGDRGQIMKDMEANSQLKNSVVRVLNYFDRINIALKLDIVEEGIIVQHMSKTIDLMTKAFSTYIETKGPNYKADVNELRTRLGIGQL